VSQVGYLYSVSLGYAQTQRAILPLYRYITVPCESGETVKYVCAPIRIYCSRKHEVAGRLYCIEIVSNWTFLVKNPENDLVRDYS
jgi:hypothetical protein